jgi:hypothetical protein
MTFLNHALHSSCIVQQGRSQADMHTVYGGNCLQAILYAAERLYSVVVPG